MNVQRNASCLDKNVPEEKSKILLPVLSKGETTTLDPVAAKKTNRCFTGDEYKGSRTVLGNMLQDNQPVHKKCCVTMYSTSQDWLLAELAYQLVCTNNGVGHALARGVLSIYPYTMALQHIEKLVAANERGDKTGMNVNGHGNFYFVETGNPEKPIMIGELVRIHRKWRPIFHEILDGVVLRREDQLIICGFNLPN